jgi:hypothetical protein
MKKDPLKNPTVKKQIEAIQKVISDVGEKLLFDNKEDNTNIFVEKVSEEIGRLKAKSKLFDYKVFVNPDQSENSLTGCVGIQTEQGQEWIVIDYVIAPDKK